MKLITDFPFLILLDLLMLSLFIVVFSRGLLYWKIAATFSLLSLTGYLITFSNDLVMLITNRFYLMSAVVLGFMMEYFRYNRNPEWMFNTVKSVIAVLLLFIVIEGVVINYIGGSGLLSSTFGYVGYRELPNSVFFDHISQGVVPGPQHASIISVVGLILFWPTATGSNNVNIIMFFISFAALLLSITNTALLALFLSVVVFFVFSLKFSFRAIIVMMIIVFVGIVIYNAWEFWFAIRYGFVNKDEQFFLDFLINNIEIYSSSLIAYIELPLKYFIFGVGHSSVDGNIENLIASLGIGNYHADFGYGIKVLEFGLVIIPFFAFLFIGTCIYVYRMSRRSYDERYMMIFNRIALMLLVFLFSMVHYPTLTQSGIWHLVIGSFSFLYNIIHLGRAPSYAPPINHIVTQKSPAW